MQHSDRTKIYLIRAAKLVIFMLIFVLINIAISKKIEPLMHKSHVMWEKYFAKESIDTVFVGTSVAEMIDANIVSSNTGRKCVNMATPSQYFGTSIKALEFACGQNPVNTVVLMMGFDSLERDEDLTSTISLEKALYYGAPKKMALPQRVLNNLRFSFEPRNINSADSINKWMSWPVNSTKSFEQITINKEQEKYSPLPNLYMSDNPPSLENNKHQRTDFNITNELYGADENTREIIKNVKSIDISEDSLDLLEQMCKYCENNGIDFYVTIAPHKSSYSQEFDGEYEMIDAFLKKYVEDRKGIYLNLDNNTDVDLRMGDELFTDMEHVNDEGIVCASTVMSEYLNEQ